MLKNLFQIVPRAKTEFTGMGGAKIQILHVIDELITVLAF